jgi:hypothetical protein
MIGDDDDTNDLAGDRAEGDAAADCPDCCGMGTVHLFTSIRPCKTCGGTGKVDAEHEVPCAPADAGDESPAGYWFSDMPFDEQDRVMVGDDEPT